MSKEIHIFPPNTKNGVAFHWVEGLLPPGSRGKIGQKYAQRAGHLPAAQNHHLVIEGSVDSNLERHLQYLSSLYDRPLEATQIANLPSGSLVVPYINALELPSRKRADLVHWGLDPQLVEKWRNKAKLHEILSSSQLIPTPDHKIVQVAALSDRVLGEFLRNIHELYVKHNLCQYPLGVVIRADIADGGYGLVDFSHTANRKWRLKLDGISDVTFDKPPLLTQIAQMIKDYYLSICSDQSQIVMSRKIDLIDSPGQSYFCLEGKVHALPWNGQVIENMACVGTTTYDPETKLNQETLEKWQYWTVEVAQKFVKSQSGNNVDGVFNIDWMLPGAMEQRLMRARGMDVTPYLAEINPRFTNWTDALLMTLWTTGQAQTLAGLLRVVEGGVLTSDAMFAIPEGTNLSLLRDEIERFNNHLRQVASDAQVLVRMIAEPKQGKKGNLGVVITGSNLLNTKKILQDMLKSQFES